MASYKLSELAEEESKYSYLLNALDEGEQSGESTATFTELMAQAKAETRS